MFGNLGIHTLKCPTGKYTLVGTLPADLLVFYAPPTTADVMGGRVMTHNGVTKAYKAPVFDTLAEAIAYVEDRGHKLTGGHSDV